jgi:predicted enzyme related to lactoylglutathione lyase
MSILGRSSLAAFLTTSKPSEARVFFEEVLGLTFESEDQYALVFQANGTTLRIQKMPSVDPKPFTILGWHVEDINAAVSALGSKGVKFERYDFMQPDELGVVTFENGARVAWFKDPDGNLLSLDQY